MRDKDSKLIYEQYTLTNEVAAGTVGKKVLVPFLKYVVDKIAKVFIKRPIAGPIGIAAAGTGTYLGVRTGSEMGDSFTDPGPVTPENPGGKSPWQEMLGSLTGAANKLANAPGMTIALLGGITVLGLWAYSRGNKSEEEAAHEIHLYGGDPRIAAEPIIPRDVIDV
jgi:hypothetical protein